MKRLLALVTCAALAACSLRTRPEPRYFVLDPGAPPSMAAMRLDATAAVNFVDVGAPFSSDGFVYKLTGSQWETDPYNQFLVSPAEMVTGALRNWLQKSQYFKNVAIPGEGGGQTYVIDCDLREIYGDFQNPIAPKAVLVMEAQVFRRSPEGRVIVLRRTFSQSIPVAERTPQALVDAWNEALGQTFSELMRALVETTN